MLLGRSGFSGVISFGFTLLKNPAEFTRIREKNKREKTLKLYQKNFKKTMVALHLLNLLL